MGRPCFHGMAETSTRIYETSKRKIQDWDCMLQDGNNRIQEVSSSGRSVASQSGGPISERRAKVWNTVEQRSIKKSKVMFLHSGNDISSKRKNANPQCIEWKISQMLFWYFFPFHEGWNAKSLRGGGQKNIILAMKINTTNFLYLSQKFEDLARFLKPMLRLCFRLCQPKCQSLTFNLSMVTLNINAVNELHLRYINIPCVTLVLMLNFEAPCEQGRGITEDNLLIEYAYIKWVSFPIYSGVTEGSYKS